MKHIRERFDTEPFLVHMKDGTVLSVDYEDGGGMFIGADEYEVHFYSNDELITLIQGNIEKIVNSEGEEVEFGNPYLPGHPRPKSLEDVLSTMPRAK